MLSKIEKTYVNLFEKILKNVTLLERARIRLHEEEWREKGMALDRAKVLIPKLTQQITSLKQMLESQKSMTQQFRERAEEQEKTLESLYAQTRSQAETISKLRGSGARSGHSLRKLSQSITNSGTQFVEVWHWYGIRKTQFLGVRLMLHVLEIMIQLFFYRHNCWQDHERHACRRRAEGATDSSDAQVKSFVAGSGGTCCCLRPQQPPEFWRCCTSRLDKGWALGARTRGNQQRREVRHIALQCVVAATNFGYTAFRFLTWCLELPLPSVNQKMRVHKQKLMRMDFGAFQILWNSDKCLDLFHSGCGNVQ